MKRTRTTVLALALLAAVATAPVARADVAPPAPGSKTPSSTPMAGADRDAHGCIGSAGYTWSALRKACIRVFEAGVRLDAAEPSQGATLSAFVVFAQTKGEGPAELFLPGRRGGIALQPVAGSSDLAWQGGGYRLGAWKGMLWLDNAQGRKMFQGPLVP